MTGRIFRLPQRMSAAALVFSRHMLPLRQLIPPLTLRAPDGRTVRAWDFKQKKNLLIAFLHADCAPCEQFLRALAAESAAWKESDAVVLAAFLESPSRSLVDSLPPAIVLGVDVTGHAATAFLGRDANAPAGIARLGIFLTDRYGELAAQWEIGARHAFPDVATLRAQIERIDMCDGCGTPLWPMNE
jgi:AhpC/TSA family protein